MRGTTYIVTSFMIAAWIAYAWFIEEVETLSDVLIVAMFLLSAMIGSIAPDADIKGSLVKVVIFWTFFVPYLILVVVPLRLISKKDHRGSVLHSVMGIVWSTAVVYLITAHQLGHYPAMAAVMGFVIGYVLHLFGDIISTNQPIKTKNIKETDMQN